MRYEIAKLIIIFQKHIKSFISEKHALQRQNRIFNVRFYKYTCILGFFDAFNISVIYSSQFCIRFLNIINAFLEMQKNWYGKKQKEVEMEHIWNIYR